MYITTNEMKQKHKGRIDSLKSWCKEHKQGVVPKLLQYASVTGGIREDVLSFFERHKECVINKDMHLAFLKLLATDAQEGWYELMLGLGSRGKATAMRDLMDEAMSAMRAGMPLVMAQQALECNDVGEFIHVRRQYEQESVQDKIHILKEDVDYFRQLYKDSHFELDKLTLELARVRRENKMLKKQLEDREKPPAHERESSGSEAAVDGMPQGELRANMTQGQKPLEEKAKGTAVHSQQVSEEQFSAKAAQDEVPLEGDIRGATTQREALLEEDVRDTMAQCHAVSEDAAKEAEVAGILILDDENQRIKEAAAFVGLVKKVRVKRFKNLSQAEQRREIVLVMSQNGYSSDSQRIVLSALKEGYVPWEHIYAHIYDGADVGELKSYMSSSELGASEV